jgi:hypothetical protein
MTCIMMRCKCVASCEKSTGETQIKTQHRAATARYLSQDRERKRSEKPGKTWSRDQREKVRESVTRGEGISTPHVRRTRRDPRPRIKKRLLNITHTHKGTQVGLGGTSSIRYRTLCLHILSGTRIRATVVRLTHAKQHKTYKQARVANMEPDNHWMELRRHPNQNTLKTANVEPDSQSLGLRRHPNQNTQSDNK